MVVYVFFAKVGSNGPQKFMDRVFGWLGGEEGGGGYKSPK